MECFRVEVTLSAYADIREAALYMREKLGAPKAAADFIDLVEDQISSLSKLPEASPLVSDYELAKIGYRWCPVGNFMMFYVVDTVAKTVVIERVLFGARDWKSLL